MYTRKISLIIAASLIGASCLFNSCKKDASSKDGDVEGAENNALAEASFNDVTTIGDQAGLGGSVNLRLADASSLNREDGSLGSACATVSIDTVSSPHAIIIDFGTSNCLCSDGRNRRGKIKMSFTGRYREAGTVISFSFDNYFVNDNQLLGTKTVHNLGLNASGNLVYKVMVDGKIIKANGATITWTSTREREWLAGAATPLILADDVYSITGSASGTTAAGKSYTILITKALIRKMSCRWFESGTVDVTPEGKHTRTLDYGNTGCDANATVTILGVTFPITLP